MNYYPDWLGRNLVTDEFPWGYATNTSLSAFLTAYTLHDSYWLGWYLLPNQEAVAVIRWDTWHTNGRIPFPGSTVAQWPLPLIRVERLYQMHMNHATGAKGDEYIPILANTIDSAESTPLLITEREAMLEYVLRQPDRPEPLSTYLLDSPVYQTMFQSIGQGQTLAIHGGETRLLCLNRTGDVLPIPGLPLLSPQ